MLREPCLCEQPSHQLQQIFGVGLQRLPANLRPLCHVLRLSSWNRPHGRLRAAPLSRYDMSGDLFLTNDEPEMDNEVWTAQLKPSTNWLEYG